ncbi:MAG: hypothetical protein GXP53_12200 [Deltaproteobacteria bacterium]|nr:hypothetical protein [Deltaproteobacteria bacterium]
MKAKPPRNSSGSAKNILRLCSALFLQDIKKSTIKDKLKNQIDKGSIMTYISLSRDKIILKKMNCPSASGRGIKPNLHNKGPLF